LVNFQELILSAKGKDVNFLYNLFSSSTMEAGCYTLIHQKNYIIRISPGDYKVEESLIYKKAPRIMFARSKR
jgi:hypothetical protein